MPTMREAGVAGHEAVQWNGFFAPARTPQPVLDRLHREVAKTVHLPDVKQRFEAEGATPSGNSPAEFAAFYRSEAEKWADVAKRSEQSLISAWSTCTGGRENGVRQHPWEGRGFQDIL
jgi:tripartite-type tricarboxylate transporter receptor subunit TctC